jgi:Kdo2-lipid IVA lauroyltransferase/acyltransferase
MRKIVWAVELISVLCLALPFALLPLKLSLRAGQGLGLLLYLAWGSRRRIAIDNIEKAVAAGGLKIGVPPKVIARRSFMNLGKSFAEIVKIYFGMGKSIIDSVEPRGDENFYRAKEKGRGVLLITGHCGNWELSALCFGARGEKISSIARAQNNPWLNRLVEKARTKYGNSVIYKDDALMAVVFGLRHNGVIGILMDQAVIPEEGIVIDFLGRPAWTIKIPAIMARRLKPAVVPAFIHREGDRRVGTFYPEVQLSQDPDPEKAMIEDTKILSSYIENYIREHPDEWLWIHRRWKRAPESPDKE